MDGSGAGVKPKQPISPGGCDLRHNLLEVLREFQALRLVVRADALAIDLIGNLGEPVVHEAPDDLPVLQDEGNVEARTFEGLSTLESELGVPVISSNSATLWATLKALNIKTKVALGQLFTST
jgi:hypothetical protein